MQREVLFCAEYLTAGQALSVIYIVRHLIYKKDTTWTNVSASQTGFKADNAQ